jgi:serine/threonine protein kinase
MDPEFHTGGGYNSAVDMWAFNCVLFTMITVTQPFPDNATDRDAFFAAIEEWNYNIDALHQANASEELIDLIN